MFVTGTAAAPAKLLKLEAHQRAFSIDNGICQDGTLAHCFVCARGRGMLKGADILMQQNLLSLEQEARSEKFRAITASDLHKQLE